MPSPTPDWHAYLSSTDLAALIATAKREDLGEAGVDATGDDFHGWKVPLYDIVDGLALAVRPPATLVIAADLPGLPQLIEEFQTFERKLTKAGTSQTFGNFREHSHDDMLFAIAIGLWQAQHGHEVMTMKLTGL